MKDVFTFVVHISCKESRAVLSTTHQTYTARSSTIDKSVLVVSENVSEKFNRTEHREVTFVALFAQTSLSPLSVMGGRRRKIQKLAKTRSRHLHLRIARLTTQCVMRSQGKM